jgi:hypothetical protein
MVLVVLLVAVIATSTLVAAVSRPPVRVAPASAVSAVKRLPVAAVAPAPPLPDRVVAEISGRKYCIGGTLCPSYCGEPAKSCEAQPIYRLQLDRPTRISRIQLYAYDDVGVTRVAELVVKLDGHQVARLPVRWEGSTLDAPVRRTGRLITIEARDPGGLRFAGEEAVISDVKVFGR